MKRLKIGERVRFIGTALKGRIGIVEHSFPDGTYHVRLHLTTTVFQVDPNHIEILTGVSEEPPDAR